MKHNTTTVAIFLLLGILLSSLVLAAPSGARILTNSTDYGPTISPTGHTANRSTITTITLDAVQQDQYWKAYVGNVTGTLTLDDAANNTIYDWPTGTVSGEVYASRSGSLNFGTVACADTATISAEEALMNMTVGGQADNITSTFNATDHTDTLVAGTTLQNCPMTSLYVNDVSQGQNNAADFQEFLMEETTNSLVYVAIINDNTAGYDAARDFDFQMIVAESNQNALAYTYYFYIELSS